MQGLRTDQLRPNDRLRSHLAHCLTCRACEDVCPAGVPYGQLIDATRAMLVHQTKQSWYPRLLRGVFLDSLLTHPGLLTLARAALRLYQQIGLRRLVRHRFFDRFDTLRRMDYLLPDLQAPLRWHKYFPPLGLERGQVGLFKGCVAAVNTHAPWVWCTYTATANLLWSAAPAQWLPP
jgi:glycolate oxidase iron-sulfur subunit